MPFKRGRLRRLLLRQKQNKKKQHKSDAFQKGSVKTPDAFFSGKNKMNKIIRKKILTFEKLTSNNFREVSQACSSMLVFEMNFQITVILLVLDLLQS